MVTLKIASLFSNFVGIARFGNQLGTRTDSEQAPLLLPLARRPYTLQCMCTPCTPRPTCHQDTPSDNERLNTDPRTMRYWPEQIALHTVCDFYHSRFGSSHRAYCRFLRDLDMFRGIRLLTSVGKYEWQLSSVRKCYKGIIDRSNIQRLTC